MSAPKFADSYNMVAFLAKPTESDGFEQILDFLNVNPIKYALTVNPTILKKNNTLCIEQFWATAKVETVNGEVQLQALVYGKKVIITETSVRRNLQLEDAEGIECLPDADIFEQLTLIGYEKPSQKLTFYKAFFSPQWKFSIHTILQYLSAKSTAWNEFSSTMASAIICLATNQKFNFSKYIFESMVKNVDSSVKFIMYPRFVQVFLDKQIGDMSTHDEIFVTPSHTRKEDASKEGRKIDDINKDAEVTFINETQGRYDDAQMFDIDVFNDLVQKGKPCQSTTTTAPSTIPKAKSITFRDPIESTTRPTLTPIPSNIKDKGKAKMIKPKEPLKMKEQIRLDEELAFMLQAEEEEQARLARDGGLLAERLQAREQEELTDEEKARLFENSWRRERLQH
ncbi:hypothetical protein Tco_0922898 [Tanacetum coccineum]|uniref:Synaptobrevin, longin-like domain protein n=1 Tax=Tanacetum coccineum TaxID=301880 RepID=A0ABQ5D0F1_9ASTR